MSTTRDERRALRSSYPTRVIRKGEPEPDDLWEYMPGERMAIVWEITKNTWAMMGQPVDTPMRRDIVRVVRRQR